jgi:hypothetical protein
MRSAGAVGDKYLRVHAEAESAVAAELPGYQHVMVIPCCDESSDFVEGLLPAADGDSLCIVVVNGGPRHDAALHERNEALHHELVKRSSAARLATDARCALGRIGPMPLLLIDRCHDGVRLPARRGVGLARKIGCDVAFALHHAGKLGSRFMHCTDADVTLPSGYFAAAHHPDAVLLNYPFRHVPSGDQALDHAHAVYEVFLRYYVLGLRFAGSPYAMHTVGSTLAIDANTYASVRGVPPREAAEDFYLVNKVCKLGPVATLDCEPISIRARHSARVPFGTGRGAADILAAAGERDVYDPRVFSLLKTWLESMVRFAADDAATLALEGADPALTKALAELGYVDALNTALAGAPAARRVARAHEWFDAFKTLKLIHALRDAGVPNRPWRSALAVAPFIDNEALEQDDPFAICNALLMMER